MEISELHLPVIRASRDATVRPLHAVALYDELISLVYAQEALNSLGHAIPKDLYLHRSIWSFSMLMRLDVRHESIRVASEADIIIVATGSSAAPVPGHVISWLNSTLRENGKGVPVLVALDEGGLEQGNTGSTLLSELSVIAKRWDAPLICNAEFDERLENGLIAELARRNEYQHSSDRDSSFYNLLSIPPMGRWGLNE